MSKTNFPIDFVITWVDGNDPVWREEKEHYLHPDKPSTQIDNRESRYRDWDNLRYWFRAVEKYAPWVHQIHLVTYGHIPKWLNLDAPKLNIVHHSDFIPREYLPVFSSHPIELNLHRIPGLSEHFVYFNDDFFLTSPVCPKDFFVNGLPCDSLEESPLALSGNYAISGIMNSVNNNDIMFASRHFDRKTSRKTMKHLWYNLHDPHAALKNLILNILNDRHFFGFNIHHLPQAYRKSTFQEVWQTEPELLHETCTHRFRNAQDVSQCVFKFWQLLTGQFHPYNKRTFGQKFNVGVQMDLICKAISIQQYKAICINDSPSVNFEETKQRINRLFADMLPEKSTFENT